MTEEDIIQLFFNKNAEPKSDCYVLDNKYLVTTDSISENTHFKTNWSSPKDIAKKLVEVNVSDIAAGGGIPTNAFLNLGLSKKTSKKTWIKEFSFELKKNLKFYSIELSGGDTYYSENTNLTLTLIGKTNHPVNRTGGKAGDYLYITGDLGLSEIGFQVLSKKIRPDFVTYKNSIEKHLRPVSKLFFMQDIFHKYSINASMDITDGLFQDSLKLAKASSVHLKINLDQLPNLERYAKYIGVEGVLSSGEELEILFLSSDRIVESGITEIGNAEKGNGKVTFTQNGKKIIPKSKGFFHFT
ncbi:MAG: thiamine-phosphate kinase [Leptospiraceae bacterium]|nr:thiamine-phosphate kinase [Leptospiraceae bacterium]MCK6379633.1 thiamine-phosphate kinase [Leptospiraceae bacterium]NUM42847.1 thiamine-phosphate kinase [Leptospiraceae bacterium]